MPDHIDADAVFWDIGGVILDVESVRGAHREFVQRLCAEHDTPYGPDEALEAWRETIGAYFREREGTSFRPAREAYRLAVDEILETDLADSAWRDTFREVLDERAEPNPDAVAAIERLADAPVHQGVLSDVDHDEGERLLDLFGVRDLVDAYTSSESVGRTKPDPAMFEAALEAAGVAPEQAVMVGDRYDHDVAGAARLGLTTVAYGTEDGPAVDHRLDDLRSLPALLGVEN